jgi:hypothetical protein
MNTRKTIEEKDEARWMRGMNRDIEKHDKISKLEDKIIASCIIGTLMREGKIVHYINLTDRKGRYTGKIKTGSEHELMSYLIRNGYVR